MNTHRTTAGPLHAMLTDFVEKGPFTGLAIGIVQDNEVVFTGEYGTANVRVAGSINVL